MGKTMKHILILIIVSSTLIIVTLYAILPASPIKPHGYGTDFSHNTQTVFQRSYSSDGPSTGLKPTLLKPTKLLTPLNINKTTGDDSIQLNTVNKNPLNKETSTTTNRFVRFYQDLKLTGPTLSPIVGHVEWLEDLSHLGICNSTDPFILAMVFTAIPNTKERQRIRQTWGSRGLYAFTKMRAIFVLGATTNRTVQKDIEAEIAEHQDIIQYNYIDSYRNLTYKTLSWMSWVRDYCLDVPWIAKIDDDIIVNPFNLNKYLVSEFKKNPAPDTIHGRLRAKNKAMRNDKWSVTKEEYPAERYPPFVLGPAYIVGRNAIEKLLEYAPYTPFLWLEDVYVTGLVAHAAGIKHKQTENLLYTKKLTRKLYNGPVAFYVGGSERSKRTAWAYIMKYSQLK